MTHDTLHDLMREATRLTRSGQLNEATEAIQRALRGTAGSGTPPGHTALQAGGEDERRGAAAGAAPTATTATAPTAPTTPTTPTIIDGCVFEVPASRPAAASVTSGAPTAPVASGAFIAGTHTHSSQTLSYKLYIPSGHADRPLPLVVMLHGCTQNPDDFAAGTGMNQRAQAQGFFVLYPEQAQRANPQRCWNWFKTPHQRRGSGEPALIAGMTQAVMKQYGIDPRRVCIAGLSAGGAMAHVVATAYPDVFAAVGVHSGLPRGAAGNVAEALAAMNGGVQGMGSASGAGRAGAGAAAGQPPARVPTIVFHGDQDRTVHPRNGEQVIASALGHAEAAAPGHAAAAGSVVVEQGLSAHGRRYTRSIHRDDGGHTVAEHWRLHGAGHAWSGGDPTGSYTDAQGPDATAEMLRFFSEHPLLPGH